MFDGHADRRDAGGLGDEARHFAGAGGPAAVSFADGRGKSSDRRLWPTARRGPGRWRKSTGCFRSCANARNAASTTLSGGQQQMAAIGRALISNPRVLLCDEISLGLAPIVIRDIYAALPRIKESGTSVIVVEQDIVQALQVADRVYCFQEGQAVTHRPAARTFARADPPRLFRIVTWLSGSIPSFRASCSAGSMRCSRPGCR